MNTHLTKDDKPTPINTDVAVAVDSLNFGNPVFIPQDEADAFLNTPKTPTKTPRKPVCPGAPARPK